jgi:hypothetical protein
VSERISSGSAMLNLPSVVVPESTSRNQNRVFARGSTDWIPVGKLERKRSVVLDLEEPGQNLGRHYYIE